MASYKDPGFNERTALAKQARLKALSQLQSKPVVDEALVAERLAAQQKREAAAELKRAARRAEMEQAKADKLAAKEAADLARAAKDASKNLTEAEKKAARDARYMARKSRKS
jgi:hypothetical protein